MFHSHYVNSVMKFSLSTEVTCENIIITSILRMKFYEI